VHILAHHHYAARRFADDVSSRLSAAFGQPAHPCLAAPVVVAVGSADACPGLRAVGGGVARYVRLTLRLTAGHGYAAPTGEQVLDVLDDVLPVLDGEELGELGAVRASDIERVLEHEAGVTLSLIFECTPVVEAEHAEHRPSLPVGERLQRRSLRWVFRGLDAHGAELGDKGYLFAA